MMPVPSGVPMKSVLEEYEYACSPAAREPFGGVAVAVLLLI
jgi:hypothetical protein